jgi:hypothetical protein
MLYYSNKKIQGTVISNYSRVEERKIIAACIYFAYRSNIVEREKKYRLLCMLLSERKVGDRELGDRKVGERNLSESKVSDWLSIFSCENGRKKETSWDKVERHKV